MSWSAHLQHTPEGLALCFREPVSRLDMSPEVAEHLASLLAVEARHRMRSVVAALDSELLENKQFRVGDSHPLCCDCLDCMNGLHEVGS